MLRFAAEHGVAPMVEVVPAAEVGTTVGWLPGCMTAWLPGLVGCWCGLLCFLPVCLVQSCRGVAGSLPSLLVSVSADACHLVCATAILLYVCATAINHPACVCVSVHTARDWFVQVNAAIERVRSNKARYRVVLKM